MKEENKTKKQLVQELTELRSQNAALKKSESPEKYRSLVENIRDVIYELDSQGVVLYISPTIRDLLGYDSTEIVGKNFIEIAHKDDLSSQAKWFSELRKGKESPSEYRIIDKSGEYKWAQTRVRPIMEDGQFKGARGILIDVTKQRRAEEAQRESEERLRGIIFSIADWVWEVDENGVYTYSSQKGINLFGESRGDIIGKTPFDFMPPDEAKRVAAIFSEIVANKAPIKDLENWNIRSNGERICLLTNGVPILDKEGNLKGYRGVDKDITERKLAEKRLRESEERFRKIFEEAHLGIVSTSPSFAFEKANPAFCRMMGYSENELRSMTFADITHPDHLNQDMENVKKVGRGEIPFYQTEKRYIDKSGKVLWGNLIVSSIRDERGALRYYLSMIIDITERKRVEEALHDAVTRYRLLFEHSPDGIVIIDPATAKPLEFNECAYQQLGYSREEFANLSIFDIEAHETFEETRSRIANVMSKGRDDFDTRQRTKKGEIRNIHVTAQITEILGHPVYHCRWRDITDRKRMEEALRENQVRLDLALRSADMGVWHWDIIENKRYFDDQTCHLLGINPATFTGAAEEFVGAVHPDDRETNKAALARTTEQDVLYEPEYRAVWPDGSVHHITARGRLVRDDKGRPLRINGIIWDITERKRTEQERRHLYDIVERSLNEIYVFDSETFKFKHVNLGALKNLKYSLEEIKELTALDIKPEFTETSFRTMIQPLLANKQDMLIFQTVHRRADGSLYPVEIHLQLVDDDKQRAFLAVTFDITEREKAAKKLQNTLESLRKAVGTTIQVMVSAVETRDPYTAGHQIRSADLARAIAIEMELPQDKIDAIRMAGSIHDIGKLSIPAEILSKPTKLSEIEFALIKEHARKGYEMLKDVESPWPLAEIVHQHHERMDGSGYPRNLNGDEILIEARILSVADVVEAMASHRPYRPGLGIDAALNEIEKNSGIIYDKTVADACLRLFREKGFKLEAA